MLKRLQIALIFFICTVGYANANAVKVIFDTDMGNDVDDALALSMLHSLQNRGELELLAITITKDHPEVSAYIDAINTFYGRGDIPIGATSSGVTPKQSRFTSIIHETQSDNIVYPHQLPVQEKRLNAVSLLRKTLANAQDNSVVIIQVGFSTNLATLLDTVPDQFSPLRGDKLVEKKVKFISIMAGAFEKVWDKTHLEYNVINDIPAAQKLAKSWPTKVVWSGFEVGLAIKYPASSIENDFTYVDRHPISESYQLYIPTPHERPTWDLTSVVYAIYPDDNYFTLSPAGRVNVLASSETTFTEDTDGQHFYLKLDAANVGKIKEMMRLLVSEPPKRQSLINN